MERIENYININICICKDLYVHSHFYIGNISQILHKGSLKSFFIYSICNYVMYISGLDIKKLYKMSITLGTPELF